MKPSKIGLNSYYLLLLLTLSLPLIHGLLIALTLLDCHLHCVRLDMNDRIPSIRCDFNVNVDILFFLTFSNKSMPWGWRLITHFCLIFGGQFDINVSNCRLIEIVSQTNLKIPQSTLSRWSVSILLPVHALQSYFFCQRLPHSLGSPIDIVTPDQSDSLALTSLHCTFCGCYLVL